MNVAYAQNFQKKIKNKVVEEMHTAMIGRNKEKSYLVSLLDEEEPQFVAVYGRRRAGKTYLLKGFFMGNC